MVHDMTDTDAVAEALRGVFGRNNVSIQDGAVVCSTGSARFKVTAKGSIETRMPLHELKAGSIDGLRVNEDEDSITVVLKDAEYVFRRP